MLTVQQALDAVLAETQPLEPALVDLSNALGLVAAEDVLSDVDSPPFDKALMDGFAVRAADLAWLPARLKILERVTAGTLPTKPIVAGTATQIMTGAPLPQGADAVVKVEDTKIDSEGSSVEITVSAKPGENVLRRGASMKVGHRVVPGGRLLRPQELGALAEVGRPRLSVRQRPTVAVLATGDELVPIHKTPAIGQIRNSNETMLCAQVRRAGGAPRPLGIARDDRSELRERILAGLESEILLLSGGVSAGTLDLVPTELAAAGVRKVFHKINMRPGKPLWFGTFDRPVDSADSSSSRRTYVFGLPGNPVSSLVCFELFVRPCIRRLMGIEPAALQQISARLATEHVARGDRPTYNPARITWDQNGACVEPLPWHGSSDLQATVEANGMAVFPGGDAMFYTGAIVPVIAWDQS